MQRNKLEKRESNKNTQLQKNTINIDKMLIKEKNGERKAIQGWIDDQILKRRP